MPLELPGVVALPDVFHQARLTCMHQRTAGSQVVHLGSASRCPLPIFAPSAWVSPWLGVETLQ